MDDGNMERIGIKKGQSGCQGFKTYKLGMKTVKLVQQHTVVTILPLINVIQVEVYLSSKAVLYTARSSYY